MRPLLIAALITLPCTAQPALELTRNEVPVYRNAPGLTKYMDQSVTFPHSDWALEGMPIGNGRLGAMVFGDPLKERIQFNDITLWTGGANESGKYDIDDPGGFGSYQNFGDLFITMMGMDKYETRSPFFLPPIFLPVPARRLVARLASRRKARTTPRANWSA